MQKWWISQPLQGKGRQYVPPTRIGLEWGVLEISKYGKGKQLIPYFPKHFLSVLVGLLKTQLFIETPKTRVKGNLVRRSTCFGPANYNVCSAFIPAGHFLRAQQCIRMQISAAYSLPHPYFWRLVVFREERDKWSYKKNHRNIEGWLTTSPSKRGGNTYLTTCPISNNLLRGDATHTFVRPLSFVLVFLVFTLPTPPQCVPCFSGWHWFLMDI